MIYEPGDITHKKIIDKPGIQRIWLFAVPNNFFMKVADGSLLFPEYESAVQVDNDEDFYKLDLIDDGKLYSSLPKESAAGPYFDVKLQGETNFIDQEALNRLETFKYCRLQVLILKKNGKSLLLGSPEEGMNLRFSIEEENKAEGLFKISINLYGQAQDAPLFTSITT